MSSDQITGLGRANASAPDKSDTRDMAPDQKRERDFYTIPDVGRLTARLSNVRDRGARALLGRDYEESRRMEEALRKYQAYNPEGIAQIEHFSKTAKSEKAVFASALPSAIRDTWTASTERQDPDYLTNKQHIPAWRITYGLEHETADQMARHHRQEWQSDFEKHESTVINAIVSAAAGANPTSETLYPNHQHNVNEYRRVQNAVASSIGLDLRSGATADGSVDAPRFFAAATSLSTMAAQQGVSSDVVSSLFSSIAHLSTYIPDSGLTPEQAKARRAEHFDRVVNDVKGVLSVAKSSNINYIDDFFSLLEPEDYPGFRRLVAQTGSLPDVVNQINHVYADVNSKSVSLPTYTGKDMIDLTDAKIFDALVQKNIIPPESVRAKWARKQILKAVTVASTIQAMPKAAASSDPTVRVGAALLASAENETRFDKLLESKGFNADERAQIRMSAINVAQNHEAATDRLKRTDKAKLDFAAGPDETVDSVGATYEEVKPLIQDKLAQLLSPSTEGAAGVDAARALMDQLDAGVKGSIDKLDPRIGSVVDPKAFDSWLQTNVGTEDIGDIKAATSDVFDTRKRFRFGMKLMGQEHAIGFKTTGAAITGGSPTKTMARLEREATSDLVSNYKMFKAGDLDITVGMLPMPSYGDKHRVMDALRLDQKNEFGSTRPLAEAKDLVESAFKLAVMNKLIKYDPVTKSFSKAITDEDEYNKQLGRVEASLRGENMNKDAVAMIGKKEVPIFRGGGLRAALVSGADAFITDRGDANKVIDAVNEIYDAIGRGRSAGNNLLADYEESSKDVKEALEALTPEEIKTFYASAGLDALSRQQQGPVPSRENIVDRALSGIHNIDSRRGEFVSDTSGMSDREREILLREALRTAREHVRGDYRLQQTQMQQTGATERTQIGATTALTREQLRQQNK